METDTLFPDLPDVSPDCSDKQHGRCTLAVCSCGCHHLPSRPYVQQGQQSAGWSGTETSQAAEPLRAESQRTVYSYVHKQGRRGATVKEVRDATGLHHGVASGALSVLHKKKYLARLIEKRDGCRVYCHPDVVGTRLHD